MLKVATGVLGSGVEDLAEPGGGPCPYVRDLSESTYAYLLGLYLGDGHLSKSQGCL